MDTRYHKVVNLEPCDGYSIPISFKDDAQRSGSAEARLSVEFVNLPLPVDPYIADDESDSRFL